MGRSKRSNGRKEYDMMLLSRIIVRWEKSVYAKKRKWTELRPDIISIILQKMDTITVLTKAMRICQNWFSVARNDPLVWRKVNMTCHGNRFGPNYLEDMACIAVNWSAGRLEEFSAEEFCTDDLLQHTVDSTSNLKSINLIRCRNINHELLMRAIKGWPLLEEIGLTRYYCSVNMCETIGRLCPRLKCFRLNKVYIHCIEWDSNDEKDSVAECIGENMRGLRSLQLIGSRMRNEGLHAILKGCPQLNSLDIRNCQMLKMDESMQSSLEGIKNLRLPEESMADYKFAKHVFTVFCDCCWDNWPSNSEDEFDDDENDDDDNGDEFDWDDENCSGFRDWELGGKRGLVFDWRLRGKTARGA